MIVEVKNSAFMSEKSNVFQSCILMPLIKILNVYASCKDHLSPDEFCLSLFTERRRTPSRSCEPNLDPLEPFIDCLKDIEALPDSIHYAIAELFMCIIRFEYLLKSVGEDFIERRRYRETHEDLHQIMVLIYILVYRISWLVVSESKDFLDSFKIGRLLSLVSYLLHPEITDLFYVKGCATFEDDFVRTKIQEPLLQAIPHLKDLYSYLREEKKRMSKISKKATVPMFLNLLNRPKRCPPDPPTTPVDPTERDPPREVPRSIYVKPATEEKLASLRDFNKQQALNLLMEANRNAPTCLRRCKSPVKVDTKEEEETKRSVWKPPPNFKPVDVKQTFTSILREYARIAKDESKEMKKLKELSEGAFDPSMIVKLEEERRRREKEEELLRTEEKRLNALLSREGAILARQGLLDEIKEHAKAVRREKEELYDRLEKLKTEHSKELAEIVGKCRELEEASREAYSLMIDEKRQKAAEVSEESRQLRSTLAKQKEEEMQRKMQLIQEIKTIQSTRCPPTKDFDPTETSGLGFLCEMSLAELKEKLRSLKVKLNEELKHRQIIVNRKRERQKNLIVHSQRALEQYKAKKRTAVSLIPIQEKQSKITVSPQIEELRKKLEERRALRMQK